MCSPSKLNTNKKLINVRELHTSLFNESHYEEFNKNMGGYMKQIIRIYRTLFTDDARNTTSPEHHEHEDFSIFLKNEHLNLL